MNTIILDTETSGLPITKKFGEYYDPIISKYYDNSRVIEIGYIVYSPNKTELFRRSFLIKPKNFTITNHDIHGITNNLANKEGIDIIDALEILECDISDVTLMVAHNINFDFNVLLSECYRNNNFRLADKLKSLNKECTMLMGQKYLKQKKYPSLKNLYLHFNGNKDANTLKCHRALDDTLMCANCYFNMKNKN